ELRPCWKDLQHRGRSGQHVRRGRRDSCAPMVRHKPFWIGSLRQPARRAGGRVFALARPLLRLLTPPGSRPPPPPRRTESGARIPGPAPRPHRGVGPPPPRKPPSPLRRRPPTTLFGQAALRPPGGPPLFFTPRSILGHDPLRLAVVRLRQPPGADLRR